MDPYASPIQTLRIQWLTTTTHVSFETGREMVGCKQALLGGGAASNSTLDPSPLQYFVFDFHVSPDVMFDKIIKISVSGEQLQPAGRPLAYAGRWHSCSEHSSPVPWMPGWAEETEWILAPLAPSAGALCRM